jgi:hypothetical protein
MTIQKNLNISFMLVTTFFICSFPLAVLADGYIPAHSLPWPLWNKATNTERTRIWTSLGEPQWRADGPPGTPAYGLWALHSGNDFRGNGGDQVHAVVSGNLWYTYQIDGCNDNSGNFIYCRMYVLGKVTDQNGTEEGSPSFDTNGVQHQYVYYYSHLWYGGDPGNPPAGVTPVTEQMRHVIENASNRAGESAPPLGTNGNGIPIGPETAIAAGDHIADIAYFSGWPHLHFGIYDKLDNYNAVNAITALKQGNNPDAYDERSPIITDIVFMPDGDTNTTNKKTPSGDCNEIPRIAYDIAANIDERFEPDSRLNDGVPGDDWWFDTGKNGYNIEVFEARYSVRNMNTGNLENHTWFKLDRVPFCIYDGSPICQNTPSNVICSALTDSNFWGYTVNCEDSPGDPCGAATPGEDYSKYLFDLWDTNMAVTSPELPNWIKVTNSGGIDGKWDATNTQSYPDGLYQIQVQAYDEAGNFDVENRFVYLNSSGLPCNCDNLPRDAYVRDNLNDIGAIPSETPFWQSPDIIVLNHDDPIQNLDENSAGIASTEIEAGTTYDVWVRVLNKFCNTIDNIQTEVMALWPSMILDPSDPEAQTEYITAGFQGSLNLGAGGPNMTPAYGYLGPFTWTPAYTGHRCLIAKIQSIQDPFGSVQDVQQNNNYTQRNIQVSGASNSFRIANTYQRAANVAIKFDCNNLPIYEQGSSVELRVQNYQPLVAAWTGVPGTVFTDYPANGEIGLTFNRCKVEMPPASFEPYVKLPATVNIQVSPGVVGDFTVNLSEYIDGELKGGMSFEKSTIIIQ